MRTLVNSTSAMFSSFSVGGEEVAQLALALLGPLDRRPVAAARQHDHARCRALCSRSAIARTACGGATPSSSPVTSSTGASMRSTAAACASASASQLRA